MEQRKGKFSPIWLSVIVGVIILAISIIPIPSIAKSVFQYLLVGIFVSFGLIGWAQKMAIIANIILWCGIIAAIVITLI